MAPALLQLWPLLLAAAAAGPSQAGGAEVKSDSLVPKSAEACHNRTELESWFQRVEEHLRSTVPEGIRPFALRTIQDSYNKRLAELSRPSRGVPLQDLQTEGADGDHRLYLSAHAGNFELCAGLRQRVPLPRGPTEFPVLLATADMCHSEKDLHVWRSCQLAEVRDNVPQAYQRFVVTVLRAQYEQRLAALTPEGAALPQWMSQLAATAPQLPAFLAVAAACKTKPELVTWHDHEMKQIPATVPKEYQQFASNVLEQTFMRRLKQLTTMPPATKAQRLGAPDATLELADKGTGTPHRHAKAVLLVLCGLALPSMFSFVQGALLSRKGQTRRPATDPSDEGFHLQEV